MSIDTVNGLRNRDRNKSSISSKILLIGDFIQLLGYFQLKIKSNNVPVIENVNVNTYTRSHATCKRERKSITINVGLG